MFSQRDTSFITMQQFSYQFLLKQKIFYIPFNFKHSIDISPNILNSIIINSHHQYQVESNVSENTFQSFVNYLINDLIPDIEIDNINEYNQLSQEFGLLREIIENKKKIFGEYLVNLNFLQNKGTDLSSCEEEIARKLDDYLEKYGKTLMKSPIQSLFNIFNHQHRKLKQHNLAYELIQQHYEETNDSNIFILLKTLDGSKLSKTNLEESISMSELHNNYMPCIDFLYLKTAIEKQETFESRIKEIENKFDDYQRKTELLINQMISKHEDEINKINENHLDEIEKLSKKISENDENINKLNQKIDDLNNQIKEENESKLKLIKEENDKSQDLLTKTIENHSTILNEIHSNFNNFFYCAPSYANDGILCSLKKKEKTPFDRLFIASQLLLDVYNLIDPNSKDRFCTNNTGSFFIDFELENAININGIQIYSSLQNFPKSFDIIIDEKTVISIQEANELKGQNREMLIHFPPRLGKKIRILQTGPNWDDGKNYVNFNKFELLSNDEKYSEGVFKTLILNSESKDPHKIPVLVTAKNFDVNSFHLIDSNHCIGSTECPNLWFQIELTRGYAIIYGFRLKKSKSFNLKSYKVICIDDVNKPIESWVTLIDINEKDKNENLYIVKYEFMDPSPPTKFIRIVQTGPNWDNRLCLKFIHFDVFGFYF